MSPLVTVLIGTSLLGCTAGVVGSFAVLRRRALVGDLVAHAALPGICLAFLIAGERQFTALLLGALVSGIAGVALITFICRWTRTKEDAAIGIVLSTFFGAGVALSSVVQRSSTGGQAGLETYIYGQAALMVRQDLLMIGGVSLVALAAVVLVYKEFKLLSFDPEFARAQGWPTLWLDLGMMSLLALVTVAGLPAVGVVLMAAMLIAPAATARLWTNRLSVLLVLAGLIGGATGAVGTLLSDDRLRSALPWDPLRFGMNNKGLPTGPLIVLVGTTLFLLSLCFAPRRGLIARAFSLSRLRIRIAREHLLRTLYELSEPNLQQGPEVALADLRKVHSWGYLRAGWLVQWGTRHGLLERIGQKVRLTPRGAHEAAALTRRHRLWELFLIHGANIAPDHVDRDADDIEHLLPPAILDRLEAELIGASSSKVDAEPSVPESPHQISAPSAAHSAGGDHA